MANLDSISEPAGQGSRICIPSDRDIQFISKLNIGEILEGRVVEYLNNHKAIVDFKGMEILAETKSPLSQGEHIVVEVARLRPKIILNILPKNIFPTDKPASLLKTYLPHQAPIGQLIESLQRILSEKRVTQQTAFDNSIYQNLKEILSNIVFSDEKMSQPEFLQNFITQSGLLYESKLKRFLMKNLMPESLDYIKNDLKGILLKISQNLNLDRHTSQLIGTNNSQFNDRMEYFFKTVTEFINNIELNQLTNYFTKQDEGYLYLQIPLAFQDGTESAELYLFHNRKEKHGNDEKEDFSLVFLLSMEGLGTLRIDTNVKKKDIHCRIAVETYEIAKFVRGSLPGLRDRLSALGFTVEKLDCIVLEDPSQAKVSFGENFVSQSIRFVDIKV